MFPCNGKITVALQIYKKSKNMEKRTEKDKSDEK